MYRRSNASASFRVACASCTRRFVFLVQYGSTDKVRLSCAMRPRSSIRYLSGDIKRRIVCRVQKMRRKSDVGQHRATFSIEAGWESAFVMAFQGHNRPAADPLGSAGSSLVGVSGNA